MAPSARGDPDRTELDPRWPLHGGIFVWIGIFATVALAIVESWWG